MLRFHRLGRQREGNQQRLRQYRRPLADSHGGRSLQRPRRPRRTSLGQSPDLWQRWAGCPLPSMPEGGPPIACLGCHQESIKGEFISVSSDVLQYLLLTRI